jgi:hypothetical protein
MQRGQWQLDADHRIIGVDADCLAPTRGWLRCYIRWLSDEGKWLLRIDGSGPHPVDGAGNR